MVTRKTSNKATDFRKANQHLSTYVSDKIKPKELR